jgi:hypothetical protein
VQPAKSICQTIHFPKSITDYLVQRFPELIATLVTNDEVDATSFAAVPVAKQSADTAAALLGLNNPDVITVWCKSRDKRQGMCDQVLHMWHLPLASQLEFASKALSADSARQVLLSDWFADSAKLVAAPRADGAVIWQWLSSDAQGLSDDEWVQAVCLAASKHCSENYAPMYATVIHRPHLAQRLLEQDSLAALPAASMVPWIDPAFALERLASFDSSPMRIGLIPFMDHPALPSKFRAQAFDLAKSSNLLTAAFRAGCPSPGSLLDLGVPLGSLTDPLLVELVASRSLLTPYRISQLAQLASAPAANVQLLARASEAQRQMLQSSIGFLRPLVDLATRLDAKYELSAAAANFATTVSDFEERVRKQALVAALEKPSQHTTRRYRYTHSYGSSEHRDLTVDEVLDTPLEELPGKIAGYRVPMNAAEIATETFVSKLGDCTTEKSCKSWENFFQILPRSNSKLKLRQVLSSSVKLA